MAKDTIDNFDRIREFFQERLEKDETKLEQHRVHDIMIVTPKEGGRILYS